MYVRTLCLMLIAACFLAVPHTASAEELLFVSEEWQDGTNADGTGFYWDLLRKVYEPAGYSLTFKVMPYARAVDQVLQGKAIAWVGSYKDEEDTAVYPATSFDADIVTGVFKAGSLDAGQGQAALTGKTVGWIKGYSYDDYLEVAMTKDTVTSRESGIKMVSAGRLDVYLDAAAEIEIVQEGGEVDFSGLETAEFLQLPLYMAFAPDKNDLVKIWDERMKQMHDAGELKPFYDKAGYASVYPF